MVHENIDISGSLKVSGSFSLPRHASSANATATTGSMYHDTTDNVAKIYNGTEWAVIGEQVGSTSVNTDIEYLLIAGGGGGNSSQGGGGGAGGYLASSITSVTSGSSFTVTVGSGGVGSGTATAGQDSTIAGATISTVTATGGGAGSYTTGGSGGSGGGGGAQNSSNSGGSGTVGQGFDGGSGTNPEAGGGGGAGEAGNTDGQRSGGDGKVSSITGTPTTYAGGGGGGDNDGTISNGGDGGGGAGTGTNTTATAGTNNTGGGGGGGGSNPGVGNGAGANGGSGVAIFAYDSGSFNCAGGIVGDAGNGRKYHQFNTTGTFKVSSTSDFSIVTDSLGLHIDAGNFDSRGTSTATDLSGNSNNMTVTGASLSNNFYYSFSSTSTYLSCASAASIKSTSSLTLEAWVKFTDLTNEWKPIFSKGSTDTNEEYVLFARPGNNVIYFDVGAGSGPYLQPSFTWASNTWYHIVATHSRPSGTSTLKVYVNTSDLGGSTTSPTASPNSGTESLYIGTGRNNSVASNGTQIAQARIYTKVLSASEILQNYNATKTNFV